jgi:hypothetical protein
MPPSSKVQLRLADFKFEHAQSLEEVQTLHAAFIQTFNTTPHGAHRERADDRRTPEQVLGWVRGRPVDLAELRRLLRGVPYVRSVNRYGFVSIQRFYIYAEQGLAKHRVSVWIYEGQLRVEYQETLLAQYRCQYDRHHHQLEDVHHPKLERTPFASPQLELLELDDEQWLKVRRRAYQRRLRRLTLGIEQLALLDFGVVTLICLYSLVRGLGRNFFPYVGPVM